MTQTVQLITLIVGALGGTSGVVAIIRALTPAERRRMASEQQRIGADAAQVISSTAVGLLETMQQRSRVLAEENAELTRALANCRSTIRQLAGDDLSPK